MKSQKIPTRLQPILWSVDVNRLDRERHKKYIIPQILNYGLDEDLKWLFNNYGEDEIRSILKHPTRGIWIRDKLRRWLQYFNFMIDPLEFEAAVKDLGPRRILIEEV